MTPNDVKVVLHEVLGSGVFLNTSAFVVFVCGWLIATALAAGVGGFVGKRGETAAVQRDLDTIKRQLRETTAATEDIRAEISGALWERQNRWSFKKDLYIRLLDGLGDGASAVRQLLFLDERLHDPAQRHLVPKTEKLMDEYFEQFKESMVAIRRVAFVVPLVCKEATNQALERLIGGWLRAEGEEGRAYLEGCQMALSEAIRSVTTAAREDLRLALNEDQ